MTKRVASCYHDGNANNIYITRGKVVAKVPEVLKVLEPGPERGPGNLKPRAGAVIVLQVAPSTIDYLPSTSSVADYLH